MDEVIYFEYFEGFDICIFVLFLDFGCVVLKFDVVFFLLFFIFVLGCMWVVSCGVVCKFVVKDFLLG